MKSQQQFRMYTTFLLKVILVLFVMPICGMQIGTTRPHPFMYRALLAEELACTIIFPQRGYAVIDDTQKMFGLTGPLCPCKGLFVKNIITDRMVGFHTDQFSTIDAIAEICGETLQFEKAADLRVVLFASHCPVYDREFKDLYGGITQQEDFCSFKNEVIKALDIKELQLKAHFFMPKNGDYGTNNETASYVIAENGDMGRFPLLYNVSPIKERLAGLGAYLRYYTDKMEHEQTIGNKPWCARSFKEFNKCGLGKFHK
jgi:hypothetical protein